jgi:hypothetical protein
MRLVEWRLVRRNSLCGFASVELPSGLVIEDCPLLATAGPACVSLPSRPMIWPDGAPLSHEAGKARYATMLRWRNRTTDDRWSAAVVAFVRETHPDSLADGGAP